MSTVCLFVHVITGVALVTSGLFLLVAGLSLGFLSALFDGNAIGLLMVVGGLLMCVGGVRLIKGALANRPLLLTDVQTWRAQELRMSLVPAAVFAFCLFLLFLFNSFRLQEGVFAYGFGSFFYVDCALIAMNLLSAGLALAAR